MREWRRLRRMHAPAYLRRCKCSCMRWRHCACMRRRDCAFVVQALVQMASALGPNMAAAERCELLKLLEDHFKDLEISLDIMHLGPPSST
jgi:hypothetical protein